MPSIGCSLAQGPYLVRLCYRIRLTIVIDNWRVMHGRSAFDGERRMCGAYIGADDWKSRRAALLRKFAGKKSDDIWADGW